MPQVVPFALVCLNTILLIISPKLQNNDRNSFSFFPFSFFWLDNKAKTNKKKKKQKLEEKK
jgi:hypothetical protein